MRAQPTQMWRRQIILALLLGLPALARAFTVTYTNTTEDVYAFNSSVTAVVFDDSVTEIVNNAFRSCVNLSGHINLTNTKITVIGREAFWGDTKITSISFPTSLRQIASNAFENCQNLNGHIDLKNTNVTVIDAQAFSNTKITSVSFPESLKSIGDGAFENCQNLNGHIDLKNTNVTVIDEDAFSSTSISSVSFPASLQHIAGGAFENCNNMSGNINLTDTIVEIIGPMSLRGTKIDILSLPSTLKYIHEGTFYDFTVASIIFSYGFETFDGYAFYGVTVTDVIDLENTNLTEIDQFAFSYSNSKKFAPKVHSILFPRSLEMIHFGAFRGILADSINLTHTNVKEIKTSAFWKSTIGKISFPHSLAILREKSFQEATIIDTIDLSNTQITKISPDTFTESTVTTVLLPFTTKSIGERAFYNSQSLAKIDMPGVTNVAARAFFKTDIKSLNVNGALILSDNNFKGSYGNAPQIHFPSCNSSHSRGQSFCNCSVGNTACFSPLPAPPPPPFKTSNPKSAAHTTQSQILPSLFILLALRFF